MREGGVAVNDISQVAMLLKAPRTYEVLVRVHEDVLAGTVVSAEQINFTLTAHACGVEEELNRQRELNDALAAKVAEWKARAEKAEAALKAAEDDRHLTTPCA